MTGAAGLSLTRVQTASLAAGLLGAAAIGAGATVAPAMTVIGSAALVVIAISAIRPAYGACFLLGVTPLIAGLERGGAIPLLRPYEALGLLVGLGIVVRLVVAGRDVDFHFERLDLAILLMAVASSIYPLFVMKLRSQDIQQEDVLYAFQLWKYYGVFLIMRFSIRTRRQVRAALLTAVLAATVMGTIALLQSLRIAGVDGLIYQFFPPNSENANSASRGRGTTTVGSAIGAADVTTYCFAVAAAWSLTMRDRPRLMPALAFVLVLGALGSGQFSGFIGLFVAAVAVGIVTRRLGRFALAFSPAVLVGAVLLQPVIDKRLEPLQRGVLPQSWEVRLDNLERFFWPRLSEDLNWLTWARPQARVPSPPGWPSGEWVYIESGHTWLLWTGGLFFLLAFFWFLWVALRRFWQIAQSRTDESGVAARGAFVAVTTIGVLMFTDPHLSFRASSDMSFSLMGIAIGGASWRAARAGPSPPGPP